MSIAIFGAGYVGLVSAACFAKLGHHVVCVDVDEARIQQLKAGQNPLFEQGLSELLLEQRHTGRLQFSSNIPEVIQQTNLYIVATGTPCDEQSHADLSQVYAVVEAIARHAKNKALLVIKSTVPVGSCRKIQIYLNEALDRNQNAAKIDVVSNPEFLREGHAVNDFLQPDRIIIGGDAQLSKPLQQLYQPIVDQGVPLLSLSLESAELAKYAANAMLACRISFINQMSQIAEKTGAMIDEVSHAIGLDSRIGPHFLQAGIGYGGSCFPKDLRALIQTANAIEVNVPLLESIETINRMQRQWVMNKVKHHFNQNLANKTIGLWGLAFKPGTNDLREACSLEIVQALLSAGARVIIYDPVAVFNAQQYFADQAAVIWCDSANAVIEQPIDALVIATEWNEFKHFDLNQLQQHIGMTPIVDGRNCFDWSTMMHMGFIYYSVGRPTGGINAN